MVIKLCIRKTKQHADGRYTLYFSFADKGKTRYIASDVQIVTPKNLKNGQIAGEPNANYNSVKLNQQLIDFQKRYDGLPLYVRYAGLDTIMDALKGPNVSTLSFREYAQKIADSYKSDGKGSWQVKQQALNKFAALHGELPLESVTKAIIIELKQHLQGTLSDTSIGMYLREIKAMYNAAVNDDRLTLVDAQPFKGVQIPKGKKREVALTIEQMRAIRDVALQFKTERIPRDVFMIIFYLGGINMKDLMSLTPPRNGRISYYRAKTDDTKEDDVQVSLAIQPELLSLIERYAGSSHLLFDFGYKYASYCNFTRLVDRGLKKVAAKAGVDVNLSTYVARHSWATIADELGVMEGVIDYVLGHSVKGMSMKYIHRRHKAADEAIRVVLNSIK
jgi:integrase